VPKAELQPYRQLLAGRMTSQSIDKFLLLTQAGHVVVNYMSLSFCNFAKEKKSFSRLKW